MIKDKIKMIKFTKNTDEIFEKLEKVKKIYNLATYPKVIEHLCNIAINNNKVNNLNFKK